MNSRKKIVVIGSGISGIYACHHLSKRHQVVLLEKESRLGGHTNTYTLSEGDDAGTPIDTGFIVFNRPNYPRFSEFLSELELSSNSSNMSFSFSSKISGTSYAGGRGLKALFPSLAMTSDLKHWKMIVDILRFKRMALEFLQRPGSDSLTIDQAIGLFGLSSRFKDSYLLPMAASIWSCNSDRIKDFPAKKMLQFFSNHFLLEIFGRPTWQTVAGGSHQYLKKFEKSFSGDIVYSCAATSVEQHKDKMVVETSRTDNISADYVVFACHANQVLDLLKSPTNEERRIFSTWTYTKNRAILHTDQKLLPSNRKLWAAWNYLEVSKSDGNHPIVLSYWMNLLQNLNTKHNYIVSLNAEQLIDPKKIIATFDYKHPMFTLDSVKTQASIKHIQGRNLRFYCGSYLGNGFHEDGVTSSNDVLKFFGCAA